MFRQILQVNFLIQRGRTLVFLLEVNCQAEKHLLKGSKLLCRKRETTSTEQRTTRTVLFHRTPKLHEREGNTVRALQVLVFSRKNIRAFDPVAAESAFLQLDFVWQQLSVEAFSRSVYLQNTLRSALQVT